MKVARLADEFLDAYQRATIELVDVFERIATMDAEVTRVNGAPGCQRYLKKTELVARGITQLDPAYSIMKKCQLPQLANPAVMLWPPPQPNIALEYALSIERMMRGPGMLPPTEQEKIEASKRQMEFYEEQEAGRERLNAEAHARAEAASVERRKIAAGG
jgi:hypothetical protein